MTLRGEPKLHRLFLLRHAESANIAADWRDAGRELTKKGRAQARAVGEVLATERVDLVLCSTAVRARQTADLLSVEAPVQHVTGLYNAGARQILAELAGVDDQLRTVVVVGHVPGVASLVYALADEHSDAAALARVRPMYPPATLVGLEFRDGWSALAQARVFMSRLADEQRAPWAEHD